MYNVGSGQGTTMREFMGVCENVTGSTIRIRMDDMPRGDHTGSYADISAIQRDLQWTPQYTDLKQMLQTSWAFTQPYFAGEKSEYFDFPCVKLSVKPPESQG